LPNLLDVEEPIFKYDYENSLKVIIEYDFFPKSIIPKFIVMMSKDIYNNLIWRTGVVLKDYHLNSMAVMKADERERKIYLFVNGIQKLEYLSIVRKTLTTINKSFRKLSFKELIPCCCSECLNNKPHLYEYSYLIKRKNKGKTTVDCVKSIEEVLIDDLLVGITDLICNTFKWNVFISYSSKDQNLIKKITNELKRYHINYWLDNEQILHGDIISQKIEEGLSNSKYLLACISNNQIQSGWCRVEYSSIIDKVISSDSDSNQKVLPLIIDNLHDNKIPNIFRSFKIERMSNIEGYRKMLRYICN